MRDWLSGRESNRGVSERCYRRLLVDPLEQRQLLSVTPASVKDILVNELYAVDQSTIAGQSLAADNDGDFVVTWTRYDDVLDALGNPVIDNETGLQMTDANIYARYFTDEVQRITLPDGVLTDNLLGSYATMTLDYNGNEVQKLSVTATYEPFVYSQSPIVGEFRLGFDVNGNSIIDAGESFMVLFDEADMEGNREAIEDGLQALGGALSDASVRIISPQEYEIAFGDASFGNDQPDIVVQSPNFTSGFFPVATITTERNPGEIVNIPISPDDPWLTAYAIEQYFKQTRTTIEIGPTGNQSFSANDEFFSLLPVYEPDTLRVGMPDVSVMPVSTPDDPLGLRTFDITFVGDSGKINQPELVVSAVKDELGNSLLASSQLDVRTIKETSPEFRVNADEPDNPFTPTVDKFDQTSPAVAMDADGDFIITWQSVVPSTPNSPASKVDIFARRFSPVGWQDPADVDFVQGVDSLGGQFRVNTFTTGIQEDPSVGMDAEGNFVIAWQSVGQDESFFNTLSAQRFNRDGDRIGNEFIVNNYDTDEHGDSCVAMSDDGHFLIGWTGSFYTVGAGVVGFGAYTVAKVYGPDGQLLWGPFSPSAPNSADIDLAASWDTNNNFVVSWTETTADHSDNDNINPDGPQWDSTGVRARMYRLYDANGNLAPAVIRDEFRANSATVGDPESQTYWPLDQMGGQPGLDADGDLVITYDGYGPDIQDVPFMNPNQDMDSVLDDLLLQAYNSGATDEEIAQLREQYNLSTGLMRGEANGVMYSSWDADPTLNALSVTATDTTINAERDGHNTRYLIELDWRLTGGAFVVKIINASGFEQDVTLTPVYTGDPAIIDPGKTRDALEAQLRAAMVTGINWPWDRFRGTVAVNLVSNIVERQGTPWEIQVNDPFNYVYEVTFIGETHDTFVSTSLVSSELVIDDVKVPPVIQLLMAGDEGLWQTEASMGIEPDGDFVTAWTQYERTTDSWFYMDSSNQNIYARQMVQDTDTAGPMATDFLLPGGERLIDGGQVIGALGHIVVTFDEELTTQGVHSALNPSNWALMKDGVEVLNGITNVYFGMSKAADFAGVLGGSAVGSNKWEAVITFDANGVASGTPALGDGHYEIVAKSSLRDVAGNALARTGYLPNGASASREFYVTVPTGAETRVNTQTTGIQENINPAAVTQDAFPNSPQSVADDGDGDYVVVWTNKGLNPGVYAKLYKTVWTDTTAGRVSSVNVLGEFRVTNDTTAMYASVARDGDGDFVVTWSAQDAQGDWNVWFRRFDAMGNALSDAAIANTEREGIQRFSTVAMDTDGDFVITWQSQDQDESGYGVYAQRYTRAGELLGGLDEIQVINFIGDPDMAEFALDIDGQVTGPITYTGSLSEVADQVEVEFAALGYDVEARVITDTEVAIRFVGDDGRTDQPPIVIDYATVGGDDDAKVTMTTLVEGEVSEFLVNDTTLGDQMFPSIAMDSKGSFVISWTSFGQDGDTAYESNIYAKQFASNDVFYSTDSSSTSADTGSQASVPGGAQTEPLIVTKDSPANHLVNPGTGYDGVGMVTVDTGGTQIELGTGSLLSTGRHILTAAHVVADANGVAMPVGSVTVTFDLATGPLTVQASAIYVHPTYGGVGGGGAPIGTDLAIIVLQDVLPASVERYDIYRGVDELNRVFEKVGYGASGTGDQGATLPAGTKRSGENRYEALADLLGGSADGLVYDFDNGTSQNDALGVLFNIPNTGLGNQEICGAHGDSGGPNFINGQIAGVTSYGLTFDGSQDAVAGLNSSFGEFGVDVRVSDYADWIDAATRGAPEFLVNTTIANDQKWSAVAMDADGDFVITWTSYNQDGTGNGYGAGANGENGIYAHRYNSDGSSVGNEFRVNTYTDDNQQHSSVAMDADGDFMIAWESFQERPAANQGDAAANSYGIYAQRYVRNDLIGTDPLLGANGESRSVLHVNGTQTGQQRFPAVAMNDTGDAVVVWSGNGLGDTAGLFTQRFEKTKDDAGPMVTDVHNVISQSGGVADTDYVLDNDVLLNNVGQFVVTFSENLNTKYSTRGLNSVLNPDNWAISKLNESGTAVELTDGVASIQFGLNQAFLSGVATSPSNKYEAVVTFDMDSTLAGNQALADGDYILTIKDTIADLFKNALDGNFDGTPGVSYTLSFTVLTTASETRVNTDPDGNQTLVPDDLDLGETPNSPQSTASDADGDYAVVWTSEGINTGVYAKLYDVISFSTDDKRDSLLIEGSEILVTADPTATYASVARDADGDFIVTWSAYNAQTGWDVFARRYTAAGTPLSAAFRVNSYTADTQRFSTVAMDHDGDFVITWQSEGQDGNGYEVYAMRYDRFGVALGMVDETQVVTFNSNPDGTFALSWDGHVTGEIAYHGDAVATAAAIQAQFLAMGVDVEVEAISSIDVEVRFVDADGGRNQPPILLDHITYSDPNHDPRAKVEITTSQDGQAGALRVNEATERDQLFPAVAMDAMGDFVVTWTSFGQDGDATDESNVYARQFVWVVDVDGEHTVNAGGEYRVNETVTGNQRWSSVAMDMQGDFAVTWTTVAAVADGEEELVGADGTQEVMARRYQFQTNVGNSFPIDNTPVGGEFQVSTYTRGSQQHSSIAMDADGDFVIAWESFQDRPVPPIGVLNVPNSFGIFAQRYVRNALLGAQGGPNGELGTEFSVNGTKNLGQRYPGVTMDDTGDVVVVWSGNGEFAAQADDQGIFYRRYEQENDVAGPTVTDVHNYATPEGEPPSLDVVVDGGEINDEVSKFVVTFGEDLDIRYYEAGAHSVLNTDHWGLLKNGDEVLDGVYSVTFGLSEAYYRGLADVPSGKYEAVVTFDLDATEPGLQALDNGRYTLVVRADVEDLFGNALDGNLDGAAGGDFEHDFVILIGEGGDDPVDDGTGDGHTNPETPGAVAVDADGDYVVVWTALDTAAGLDQTYLRRYYATGVPKAVLVGVTGDDPSFAHDVQSNASVAMDADGDFVVTWTNYRDEDGVASNGREQVDVYARRYDSDGTAAGDAFRVNTFTAKDQKWSSVAMDTDGDFVITWSSYGQENNGKTGYGYGVYARRYDSFGQAYGCEFQVNTTISGNQKFPSVAMDAVGSFVIVWQSDRNGVGDDIVGRAFNADGSPAISPLAGEFVVNDTITGDQRFPDVSMNLSGETYVVTWSSSQHTADQSGYGVYTKTFNRITATEQSVRYEYDGVTVDIPDLAGVTSPSIDIPIVVGQGFLIRDLNVRLNVTHADPSDLIVTLISPAGTQVRLFTNVPIEGDENGSTSSGPNGSNFSNSLFDDEAELAIDDSENGALPPFDGTYIPEQLLSAFDGQNAGGTWILRIQDSDPGVDPNNPINPGNDPDYFVDRDGLRHRVIDGGRLRDWSIDFIRDPAASAETLVNTTLSGNQMYSSVSMDHEGNFVVAWSGYGDQIDQEDQSEYGVFFQRFNAAASRQGIETRMNVETQGMQWLPSVGSDGEGNFVAVWTGDVPSGGGTNVYQYVSANHELQTDLDGPIVTGVLDESGSVVLDNGVLAPGADTLIVLFGENLSVAQSIVDGARTPSLESILNPNNWVLERDGMEIHGAVTHIRFGLNNQTGKYEAELTLDGNGIASGTAGLQSGQYVLTVRDLVEDLRGNALDGDFNGVAGTDPASTGYGGYHFNFIVAESDNVLGPETRVNEDPLYVQRFSEPQGTGYGRETSTTSLAVDDDGDYVVVWTSLGQDDPNDPDGAGIYLRLYDRSGAPRTGDVRVNNLTSGDQRNAAVAMDADGDFIVTWESQNADGNWDVYAQRFDAAGNRLANGRLDRIDADPYRNVAGSGNIEVLVNTTVTGEQFNPSVAVDNFGNYVIVWGSAGQQFGYFNNVNAQLFDYRGRPTGNEFQVNAASVPGAPGPGLSAGFRVNPSVAMDDNGNFAVAWDQITAQQSGVVTDANVVGRLFDRNGVAAAGDFVVPSGGTGGTDVARIARNPQVAMAGSGDFVIVYEVYDAGGTEQDYDIFATAYAANGAAGTSQAINTLITADDDDGTITEWGVNFTGDQVNPSVALDASGNFAVVWNGNGAEPDPLDVNNADLVGNHDPDGVFARWYQSGSGTNPTAVSVQEIVNRTQNGVQQFPTIAMTPSGDVVVAWQGNGVGDRHGIFVRTYDEPTDTAGPLATELRESGPGNALIADGDNIYGNPVSVLVVFDEEMNTTRVNGAPGLNSVENLNNWALVNGRNEELDGAIHDVDFHFDEVLKKWTAVVTFAGSNGNAAALANGTYTLIARTEMYDVAGNPLAMTGYRPNGTGQNLGGAVNLDPLTSPRGGFGFLFRVNNTLPGSATWGDVDQQVNTIDDGNQNDSAVARNASGDYVVVWVDYAPTTDPAVFEANIRGQQFDFWGREVGNEFLVNSLITGDQIEPDVAIDDLGNFVVVWSGNGGTVNDVSGVFAQRFDADAKAVGGQFRVNQFIDDAQSRPAVAMNANSGDFVITWTSYLQDGNRDGVYARRFSQTGLALGNEFLVNTTTTGSQRSPDVSMDALGSFVVAWAGEEDGANGWGVYAQRFSAAGAKLGSEFRVNTYRNGNQDDPAIASNSQGSFVITWASEQDGSGYGIYAQRYSAAGAKLGGEFRVNRTTVYGQMDPAIAWASDKAFVITWTSFNQDYPQDDDVRDNGIFARMFNSNGTDYIDTRVGPNPIGEFLVNALTEGDQVQSAVSMDAGGHYVITWTGPDRDTGQTALGTAIYSRLIDPPIEAEAAATPVDVNLTGTSGSDVFEFVGGAAQNSWIVKVNGVVKYVGTNVGTLTFNGLGGQDSAILTGSSAADRVEMWADHATLSSEYYTVVVTSVESITAIGSGGADTAILHDTAGDDTFVVYPDLAQLTGTGVSLRAEGFETVTARATAGGADTAQLYDSVGEDAFTSSPASAKIQGTGYLATAEGFDYVKAYSTAGGSDAADLYDSAGNDALIATPTYAKLTGDGFYTMATGFRYARAYSTGGKDTATMTDSAGNDTFIAGPTYAKFYGDGFYNRADRFRYVTAYGKLGGTDTASLYDSAGNDSFVAGPHYGEMYGSGYSIRADFFQNVTGYGNAGGYDVASLYDSAGNDTLEVTEIYGQLYGNGFHNRAYAFDRVEARATGGGYDVADLHDSAMNDYLEADSNWASLSNQDLAFAYWAAGFDKVTATSTNRGDTKKVGAAVDFLFAQGMWENR